MVYEFFSGSYGEGASGIVRFRMDTGTGTLEQICAYRDIRNPSYVALNGDKTILYAVQEEVPIGAIHALSVDGTTLKPLRTLSSEGADPCYISLCGEDRSLLVSNYSSGSLAVFRLNEDGVPAERVQLIVHKGKGMHPVRQTMPHVHFAKEQSGQVFAVDLGLDQIFLYSMEGGRLADSGKRLQFPAGTGPRHIEFHPDDPGILYVSCELGSEVAVWKRENGAYRCAQTLSTLPGSYMGGNIVSAIKMQGRLLFAGNRGHDSVAVFRVEDDGLLMRTQIVPTGGKTPWDFSVFDDYLVIANRDSDSITVLKADEGSGILADTGITAKMGGPTCICKIQGEYDPSA